MKLHDYPVLYCTVTYLNRKVREYSTRKRIFLLKGAPSWRNQSRNIPQIKNNIPIMKNPIIWTFFRPTLSRYWTESQYPGTAVSQRKKEKWTKEVIWEVIFKLWTSYILLFQHLSLSLSLYLSIYPSIPLSLSLIHSLNLSHSLDFALSLYIPLSLSF